MLETVIPNHEEELLMLARCGNAGFFLGFGLNFMKKPDYFFNSYPEAWSEKYQKENLVVGDPTVFWVMTKEGSIRWSELTVPDLRGVMAKAKKHGLKYGASFVTVTGLKRSFLSVARNDRELTDSEMTVLLSKLEMWARLFVKAQVSLTDAELKALATMRDGLSQSDAADRLQTSVSTLKARLTSAQKKLGARNINNAVALAVRQDII